MTFLAQQKGTRQILQSNQYYLFMIISIHQAHLYLCQQRGSYLAASRYISTNIITRIAYVNKYALVSEGNNTSCSLRSYDGVLDLAHTLWDV